MQVNLDLAQRMKHEHVKLTIDGMKEPLRQHQLQGVGFLYWIGRGLLADKTGVGKTQQALGLTQLLKNRSELAKAIVITVAPSVQQWVDEATRFTDLKVVNGRGSRDERRFRYHQRWDLLVTNYEVANNDVGDLCALFERCRQKAPSRDTLLILDEISRAKHHDTKSAAVVKRIATHAHRVVTMSATPVQNSLLDLHSIWETMYPNEDDPAYLGSLDWFRYHYCRWGRQKIMRGRTAMNVPQIVGYRNLDELKAKTAPYILRRSYEDLAEGDVPDVVIEHVYGEMTTEQEELYAIARRQARQQEGAGLRRELRLTLHTMQQIVDGTYTAGKDYDRSWKLDRVLDLLQGDLQDEKVVIFSMYKRTIAALIRRLRRAGITYGLMTGDEAREDRYALQKRFLDPDSKNPRIIIGTVALEMSLNLQMSRYMICLDYIRNPKRVEQLYGRIRRIGSPFSNVVVMNLITAGTFEERLLQVLARREAVSDEILGDENSGFFAQLSPQEIRFLLGT